MKHLSLIKTKQYVLLILCFGLTISAAAQLAMINDEDGFTNVRKAPNAKAEVIYKLQSNQLFGYDNDEYNSDENWVLVHIPKNKFSMHCGSAYLIGYLHKSRIKPLESIKTYSRATIAYTTKSFSKNNKVIDLDQNGIKKINGRGYWGDDGFTSVEIDQIKMIVDSKIIPVPKLFISDIFSRWNSSSFRKKDSTVFINDRFSDGAGSFTITWAIENGEIQQRIVHRYDDFL